MNATPVLFCYCAAMKPLALFLMLALAGFLRAWQKRGFHSGWALNWTGELEDQSPALFRAALGDTVPRQ